MNKAEKQITKAQLNSEEKTLKELEAIFKKAKKDTQSKIADLNARTDMQNLQSIVYQRKYQEAILKQIDSTLKELQSGQYKTIEQFLTDSYDNGYIGMMYSLQQQGIPMTIPIDDRKVVRALTTDSKIVRRYYEADPLKGRVAENYELLKDRIRSNLSRGIVAGKSWIDVATDIASGMNNPFDIAFRDSMRIVRTEGHRVNQQGFIDAGDEAKKKGADIVKQWDATLDRRTRTAHRLADGQIKEWDEPFEVGGEKLKAPSIGGSAWNVCNCRCQLLQRAKWALDDAELKTLQDRANFFGLDKSESFEEYKQKYLTLPKNADTISTKPKRYPNKTSEALESKGVKYNQVSPLKTELTESEVIGTLAGGDNTSGSCASVGLAYIGRKQGYDVLDFRDGDSRDFFSSKINKVKLWDNVGVSYITENSFKSDLSNGKKILKNCEVGKEYYLSVGRHASIVRAVEKNITDSATGELLKTEKKFQYLELQSARRSGWTDFASDVRDTLKYRFGCSSGGSYWNEAYLTEISQLEGNKEFIDVLGYINTAESEQRKGSSGTIK